MLHFTFRIGYRQMGGFATVPVLELGFFIEVEL